MPTVEASADIAITLPHRARRRLRAPTAGPGFACAAHRAAPLAARGRPSPRKRRAPVHRDGTPQGRPYIRPNGAQPYIRVVPCTSAPRAPGWKLPWNKSACRPLLSARTRRGEAIAPAGRALALPGHCGCVGKGRDKLVPYRRSAPAAFRPRTRRGDRPCAFGVVPCEAGADASLVRVIGRVDGPLTGSPNGQWP